MKTLSDSARPMSSVLPRGVDWIRDTATEIIPTKNVVVVGSGDSKQELQYDYLVVAVGIQLQYEKVRTRLHTTVKL